jgi:hypothetical protein
MTWQVFRRGKYHQGGKDISEIKKNVNPVSCSGALKIVLPFTYAVSYCFSPGQVLFFCYLHSKVGIGVF